MMLYAGVPRFVAVEIQYKGKEVKPMPTSEAKKKYDLQYAKDKLKRIPLDVQKNKYEEIKVSASAAGESINGYIKKAIDQRMEREKATE